MNNQITIIASRTGFTYFGVAQIEALKLRFSIGRTTSIAQFCDNIALAVGSLLDASDELSRQGRPVSVQRSTILIVADPNCAPDPAEMTRIQKSAVDKIDSRFVI